MQRRITVYMDDNVYELLVKEAARRQLHDGEVVSLSKCANYIIKESLNGKPDSEPVIEPDSKQDIKKDINPTEHPPETNPFSDISFD